MKKQFTKRMAAAWLSLCLMLSLCPIAAADSTLTIGDDGLYLIKEAEGFRSTPYLLDGKYYIGYGTQCDPLAYPAGITKDEAALLLREKLCSYEKKLNDYFAQYGIEPTQGQFDALMSFTYNFGSGWMSGTSNLMKITSGQVPATRLETAQAFGEWCHVSGAAKSNLAQRRLNEAALYLDGSFAAAKSEFAYLIITKESGVSYETDFRVYTLGSSYGSFPGMEKAGYSLQGLKTSDGTVLTQSSIVKGSITASALWQEKTYTAKTYSDVPTDSWYYQYVMDLSESGVINGNPDGTFAPARQTTAGEALKLILLAAGHGEQTATNDHWASGYGNYALSKGYLSSRIADFNSAITRLSVAQVAAKALGYGASVSASPFPDVDDGYVTALYEAGVIQGSLIDGALLFNPSGSITRSEIAAIIYRINRLAKEEVKQTITYNSYTLAVLEDVPTNDYVKSAFSRSGSVMQYSRGDTMLGIDVSRFQGDIDWEAVKDDGIEFAIIRVGGRYYTKDDDRVPDAEPTYLDVKFRENIEGALEAGLMVGVYYFSQAITVKEAKEEADIVLDMIDGYRIDGPVVFDWEVIGQSSARTYGISTETLCACANAFCNKIKKAGYSPMIYFNKYAGYVKYDLSEISDYDFWFAEYDVSAPSFYYDFQMWQYTSKGKVSGISGNVDMNLWFR